MYHPDLPLSMSEPSLAIGGRGGWGGGMYVLIGTAGAREPEV